MTIAQKNLDTLGRIVSARIVRPEDEVTIITAAGQALRLKVADIRQAGRATMGTRLINLKEGDSVASVARLAAADLKVSEAQEESKVNGREAEAVEVAGAVVEEEIAAAE